MTKPLANPQPRRARHGTRSKYSSGCRCEPCKQASRDYARERRALGRITLAPDGLMALRHDDAIDVILEVLTGAY